MNRERLIGKIFIIISIIMLLVCNIVYAEDVDYNIGKSIFKMLFSTIAFILVIILAIYGTRFIAKNSKKFVNSKYMRIVDILNLDVNTKIAMVEINNYLYVFAINNNTIIMIDKFPKENLIIKADGDFDEQLKKYKQKYAYDNEFLDKLKQKFSKPFKKVNNSIDKEDRNDEKKH
ncbi:MAG: FliO/MopB family protein [Tissierellia bacterium]|nr:FliO/MopB family protein [Tissierellia bacterium]